MIKAVGNNINPFDPTLMQKTFTVLLLAAACTIFPFTMMAQDSGSSSSNISITATARVVKSIEMRTIRDMQFSEVQPSQQQISIDAITDANTGKMIAIGNANARIRVSFVRQRTLTHVSGNGSLTFTYEVAGNEQDDQASAELLQADNRDLTLNNEGRYYFWIGGQVNVENAKPGNYNGDFTIEVEYI